MNHRLSVAAAGIVLLCSIPSLSGCGAVKRVQSLRPDGLSTRASDTVEIRGEAFDAARPLAIDIENMNGSVYVKVSDRYDKPTVQARAVWQAGYSKGQWEELKKEEWIIAEHVVENDMSILRVMSQATPDADPAAWVDMNIYLPSCDGVFIRGAGGPIKVIGAGGAHTIESGFEGSKGGAIEVKTDRRISDPVSIKTTEGHVDVIMSPNSGGALDLQAQAGRAVFGSKFGRTTDVRAERGRWTGIWNAQSNPITVQTLKGDVVFRANSNPEMHSTGQSFRY